MNSMKKKLHKAGAAAFIFLLSCFCINAGYAKELMSLQQEIHPAEKPDNDEGKMSKNQSISGYVPVLFTNNFFE